MTTGLIPSSPARNDIIQEIYLDGYSNGEIYQFMAESQLSIRRIQYVVANFNFENTHDYARNCIIRDIYLDGVSVRNIHRFMALPQLSLRSIQLITKRALAGEL